jgi:hypothetical protein
VSSPASTRCSTVIAAIFFVSEPIWNSVSVVTGVPASSLVPKPSA